MKKITFLCIAVLTFAFSFTAKAQCDYTLEMNDSWGDGWNGNTMDVLVNGVVVLDDVTFTGAQGSPAGEQFTIQFTVNDGDEITTLWNGGGDFGFETSYRILDLNNIQVGSGAQASITTPIIASCAICSPPAATLGNVSNDTCGTTNTFDFEVNVTDLGGAASLTISNTAGVTDTVVTETGVVVLTGFPTDTQFDLILIDDEDTNCNVVFSNLAFLCPVTNDTCAEAIPLSCDDVVSGSTGAGSGATNTGGNAAPDVWYSFNGGGTPQDVTLSLCNSSFDTLIRVYDACSGTQIALNDDACGAGGTRSRLTFGSDGTTTYYIMVEGFGSSAGAYELAVTCSDLTPPPANNECANAVALSPGISVEGTTAGATQNLSEDQPSCDPFGTIADVWYSVELNAISDLTINTTITGTSDEANVAIYSACGGLEADELDCSDENGGESVTLAAAEPGVYYIRVWSDGATARVAGTFDIVADVTLSTDTLDSETAFNFYPNPVSDVFTLKAQNTIQNVSIFNVLGQEVLRTAPNVSESNIDLSPLQTGSYFVQVTINNVTKIVRVIKQ